MRIIKFNAKLYDSKYFQLKSCNTNTYEKLPRVCDRKAIDGMEKLIDAYALETLKFLCSDYQEDNDTCDKVHPLLPKIKLKENEISKSPANLIAILDSIKE